MDMDDQKRRRNMLVYVLIAFVIYVVLNALVFPNYKGAASEQTVSYDTLWTALEKKKVDKIDYEVGSSDATITYTLKDDADTLYKTTPLPSDTGLA